MFEKIEKLMQELEKLAEDPAFYKIYHDIKMNCVYIYNELEMIDSLFIDEKRLQDIEKYIEYTKEEMKKY